MTEPTVVFIVALLFPPEVTAWITRYSENVNQSLPAPYTLNGQSVPHLSLLHFRDSPANAREIWRRIQLDPPLIPKFQLAGLTVTLSDGGYWLALRVLSRENLLRIQTALVKKLGSYEYRNGLGDCFDPHITLAGWDSLSTLPKLPLDADLMNIEIDSAVLGLSIAGPKGQFTANLALSF